MPRRGHRKSRAGCAECKRRHVKCDETHPACVNCKVASLTCSYTKDHEKPAVAPQPTIETPSYSPITPESSLIPSLIHKASTSNASAHHYLNMVHLELLHQYTTSTYRSFGTDIALAVSYRETAVSNALRFPFLMYAILALSAIHMSKLQLERAEHYRAIASSLQELGLTGLNDTLLNISTKNCVAIFIFSSNIGLHSFCDTFTFRDVDFNQFLDRLTSCMRLMRGVRSILGGWWEYLHTTALADLFAVGHALGGPDVEKDKETAPIWNLLTMTDLGPSSAETYKDAVTKLQQVFNAEIRLESPLTSISMVYAWPVMIDLEYTELLAERRPEALVILAFYGVILHRHREAWSVGDSGQFLIRSISNYLGKHWEQWLSWPNAVLASTPSETLANTPC